jgi:hypothetical protein
MVIDIDTGIDMNMDMDMNMQMETDMDTQYYWSGELGRFHKLIF